MRSLLARMCHDPAPLPEGTRSAIPACPSSKEGMSDRFDWSHLEPEAIVAPSQIEIVVYLNPNGDLVIRRRPDEFEQEDIWVVVGQAFVLRLVDRIAELYGFSLPIAKSLQSIPADVAVLPPPERLTSRDPTGAERQRRFRERRKQRRNGGAPGHQASVSNLVNEENS